MLDVTTIDVRGDKEAIALLDSLSGNELQNRTRRGTRAGAKVMRDEGKAEARARSELPKSYRRFKTKGHRTPVGTSTGPTTPLLNIFEGGAGRHSIGDPGQPLVNQDAGFFARGPVSHPGMGARPFVGPVFERTKDEASDKAMDAFLEGLDRG